MSKEVINNMLFRSLKSGKEFNHFLPENECNKTFLGDGDTFLSMDLIKDSIEEHQSQTKKLATVLKGENLSATVGNIYQFLYEHIQYKADNADQFLRSPACSWASRKEGIDCKSYSIFAGCVLMNLNIQFRIRKIKQAAVSPNQYTHVYIVVPKNQKTGSLSKGYFVIDGTKHSNNEATFLSKKDIKMRHYGLNAGYQVAPMQHYGLNCVVPQQTREKVADFLSFCVANGANPQMMQAANRHAQTCFVKNIDPTTKMDQSGICIQNKHYPFNLSSGLNGGGNGEFFSKLFDTVKKISKITDLYESTLGAVLGNNWRLGCWNTSTNPREAEKEAKFDYAEFLKRSGLQDNFNTTTFNNFMYTLQVYIAHRLGASRLSNLAKCSRDGHKAAYNIMKAFYNEAIASSRALLRDNNGNLADNGSYVITSWEVPIPSGYGSGTFRPGVVNQIRIYKFRVVNPVQVSFPDDTGGGNGGGNNDSGDQNQGGNQDGNTLPDEYYILSDMEKWIYDDFFTTGTLNRFNTFTAGSPQIKSYSKLLYRLLGVNAPAGATNKVEFHPKSGGSNIIPRPRVQKAGMSPISALLLAGLAYGAYTQMKKPKGNKTPLLKA